MTKSEYYLGIFFIGLSAICNLLQSLILLKLGFQVYSVPSFPSWFILTIAVDLIGSILLLKYYYYKKYWIPFSLALIMQVAILFLDFVIYNVMVLRNPQDIYISVILVVLSISILFGISLAFTKSGKRIWLKAAGAFQFIFGLILISTILWSLHSFDSELNLLLEKINLWVTRAVILVPCLLILNFLSELRNVKTNVKSATPLNTIFYLAAVAICIPIFVIGREVVNESIATGRARSVIGESATGAAKPFEARIYTDRGDTLRYRILKPLGYNPAQKYPIVVLLHHGGAHGNDNVKQVEGSEAPFVSNYENIRKYPAFLFVPQCQQNMNWMSPAINISVLKTLQVLEKEFSIDVKRRYVMGVSGGGYGSWHFIGAHPGMFAAAIPICGGGNPRQAKNMLDVAIWAFHGKNDGLAPVSGTREMIAAIKREGGTPRYTEFPDEGHDIGRKVKITPGLLDWLFSQRRNEKAPE